MKAPTKSEEITERKNQKPTLFWHLLHKETTNPSSFLGKSNARFRSTSFPSKDKNTAIETTKIVEATPPKIDTKTEKILVVMARIISSRATTKASKLSKASRPKFLKKGEAFSK